MSGDVEAVSGGTSSVSGDLGLGIPDGAPLLTSRLPAAQSTAWSRGRSRAACYQAQLQAYLPA